MKDEAETRSIFFKTKKYLVFPASGVILNRSTEQDESFYNSSGYKVITIGKFYNKTIITGVHRLLMELYLGRKLLKSEVVNHRNHRRDQNCILNLELVSQNQNNQYRRKFKNNITSFKGVSKCRNKFRASICFEKTKYSLGCFATAEEGARAYDLKARELNKEKGAKFLLNFPEEI